MAWTPTSDGHTVPGTEQDIGEHEGPSTTRHLLVGHSVFIRADSRVLLGYPLPRALWPSGRSLCGVSWVLGELSSAPSPTHRMPGAPQPLCAQMGPDTAGDPRGQDPSGQEGVMTRTSRPHAAS